MKYLIYVLIVGAVAGWLAGKIMKGRGFGLIGDLIVGILGSIIGSILFDAIGLQAVGLIGNIICATVGAVALIYGLRIISAK